MEAMVLYHKAASGANHHIHATNNYGHSFPLLMDLYAAATLQTLSYQLSQFLSSPLLSIWAS